MGPRALKALPTRPPALFAAALAVLVSSLSPGQTRGSDCVLKVVGLDTSLANLNDVAFFGRAWSQVFAAGDTLISSITVWRPATPYPNATPVNLYILDVRQYADTLTGPDPLRILLEGLQVSLPSTSDQPLPARFVLDPPFALPHRGTYAFAAQEGDPYCQGGFVFMFDTLNAYPDGSAWKMYPNDYCGLGLGVTPYPQRDLIFQIEFCESAAPVRMQTWGAVKATYR
jgi:hypothetical protein